MDHDEARLRVIEDIATVGELTRMVTQRYDAMFAEFYAVLLETLDGASDMADAALTTMSVADAAVDSVRSNFAGQPHFACSKGCSPCCHLFVAVPPGVAEVIAAHVDNHFTVIEREKLVSRLEAKVAADAASATPQLLRTPCALLDDGGSCTVYAVRPLSCRSFTSTSLPRCQQVVFGDNPDGGGVDQNPARYRLYEFATRALEETARRRGLPGQQQGLSSALLQQLAG
ncbi:YkgJ family cysteine cluster protein [Rhizobium tumorigenes]|uniref:YkgJ family cysteine cluster protein n=1 Tax=Rhizobium tumorigenes TaxID=2041385 RepID=A0AAF1KBT3_9HYPH|nr:YkgJ family cysteine cluster protein [Rhizobium tumorigenes]WFR96201.1 YkgJ family cysteine cluster protein [Rhizobium tumorigenes]